MSDDGRMGICAVLQELQLYTCCYNPAKRKETTSLVRFYTAVMLRIRFSECFDEDYREFSDSLSSYCLRDRFKSGWHEFTFGHQSVEDQDNDYDW